MATAEFIRTPPGVISTERLNEEAVRVYKPSKIFTYKPFAGREGSSSCNFVPADWLVSKLADILGVSDEDMKRK